MQTHTRTGPHINGKPISEILKGCAAVPGRQARAEQRVRSATLELRAAVAADFTIRREAAPTLEAFVGELDPDERLLLQALVEGGIL